MASYIKVRNRVAFHPGYYIEEFLESLNISKYFFSEALDISVVQLDKLISGDINLTIELAETLSRLTNTSIEYWKNLQNSYDEIMGNKSTF